MNLFQLMLCCLVYLIWKQSYAVVLLCTPPTYLYLCRIETMDGPRGGPYLVSVNGVHNGPDKFWDVVVYDSESKEVRPISRLQSWSVGAGSVCQGLGLDFPYCSSVFVFFLFFHKVKFWTSCFMSCVLLTSLSLCCFIRFSSLIFPLLFYLYLVPSLVLCVVLFLPLVFWQRTVLRSSFFSWISLCLLLPCVFWVYLCWTLSGFTLLWLCSTLSPVKFLLLQSASSLLACVLLLSSSPFL